MPHLRSKTMPAGRMRTDNTRESRGPETGRYLEDDTFALDAQPRTRKKRRKGDVDNHAGDEFDDDLVR